MDRQIVYPGAIPLDTDLLSIERNIMVAIGYLAQAALGSSVVAVGLGCVPTQPATMSVTVGPGGITQLSVVDVLPFGSLPAEPTEPLVKMGTNVSGTNFTLTAPTGSGAAIVYLIEANLLEIDATPVVLPYYNAANPSQPYSGPGGDGLAQNTQRLQQVQLQLKAGVPAQAGSQQPPPVDAGWAGLYTITVQSGQTAVTAANIVQMPNAPFLPWTLTQLSPGTRNVAVFTPTTQENWTVPAGVTVIQARIWGGGGAGGEGFSGAGGGGAGGGYSEGFYPVSAGQSFFVTVGNGGVGNGTPGGPSSVGSLASAAGGTAGASGTSGGIGAGGTSGGGGSATGFVVPGQPGGFGVETGAFALGGAGGGAYGGGGSAVVAAVTGGAAVAGASCALPGGGGGGGVLGGPGGQGGPGLVLIAW